MKTFLDEFYAANKQLACTRAGVEAALDSLLRAFKNGKSLLLCGNGGSAADSEHIAGELVKSFRLKRKIDAETAQRLARFEGGGLLASRLQKGLPAIPLVSHSSVISAVCNDTGADMAYAQQVMAYGGEGGVLLGITTSGNAQNVINACTVAAALGMKVIALTGEGGGRVKALANALIAVPETETYLVQEMHIQIYHALCLVIERELFGE